MKKGVFIFLAFLAGAVILVFAGLNLPFSQKFATRKINLILNRSEIPVELHRLTRILPGSVEVVGVKIAGPGGDTVIVAGEVSAGIRIFPLLRRRVVLKEVYIHGVRVALLMNTGTGKFNIEEAFPTKGKDPWEDSAPSDWIITVRRLEISDIRFRMNDPPGGLDIFQEIEFLGVRKFQLKTGERTIRTGSLETRGGSGYLAVSPGNPSPKSDNALPWSMELLDLLVKDVRFSFTDAGKELMLDTKLNEVSMHARSMDWPARSLDIRNLFLSGDLAYRSERDSITGNPLWFKNLEVDLRNMMLGEDQGRATLKNLQLAVEDGITLRRMNGELFTEPGSTRLELVAETGSSRLNIRGTTGSELTSLLTGSWNPDSLQVEMDDCLIALKDLSFLLPPLDSFGFYPSLVQSPVQVDGRMVMAGRNIHVDHLMLQQDNEFRIDLWGGIGLRGGISDLKSFPLTRGELEILLDSRFGRAELSGTVDFPSDSLSLRTSFEKILPGELAEIPGLGAITGSGVLTAAGLLNKDTLRSRFSLSLDTLTYLDYPYHQILVKGNFLPGYLTGELTASDSSLRANLYTEIHNTDTAIAIHAEGDLSARLEQLGLLKDTMAVESVLSARVRLLPDGIETRWTITELNLSTPPYGAFIDSLSGTLSSDREKTGISAKTGFFSLDGEISLPSDSLTDLPARFRSYLTTLRDSSGVRSENRLARIPGMKVAGHAGYHPIVPILLGDTGIHFSGLGFSIDRDTGRERLQARVTGSDLSFKGLNTKNLEASLADSTGNLNLMVRARNTRLFSGPEYHWDLNSSYENRGPYAQIRISDLEEQVVYRADLHGILDTGNIRLEVPSGKVILNRQQWEVDTPEILSLDLVSNVFEPDLRIRADSSVIFLHSLKDAEPLAYQLGFQHISLNSLVREDLTAGMPSGRFNGKLSFSRIREENRYVETDLEIEKGSYAGLNFNRLAGTGTLVFSDREQLEARLGLQLDSSSVELTAVNDSVKGFQMEANLYRFPVRMIEPMVHKQVSEVNGHVSGAFHLLSSSGSVEYGGALRFENTALKVNALNSRFTIPDQQLDFAGGRIIFNRFRVLDSANKALTITGSLDLGDLQSPVADLEISSAGIQLMNRSMDPGVPFTGNIFVDSRFSVEGPLPNPEIDGRILLTNGTEIYYQLREDLSLSESDQIVSFTGGSPAKSLPDTNLVPHHMNFLKSSIETMVDIDPETSISFRVARRLYDLGLTIKGGGSVSYNLLDNNQAMLTGSYEIRQGDALLKLTGWPDKRFSISEGGYLRWDGSMEDPELRIEARNQVRSSYIHPVDGRTREVDVNVILQLSNRLSDLEVVFGIETPDQYITSVINTLSPEEQMQQAVSILLFETIDLPGLSSSTDYMTQQVNQLVASQINQLTSSAFRGVDISVGIDSYHQPVQGGGETMKTNLTYQVRKSLLDNRAQFELTGRVNDFYQQPGASDISLHDISFEYRLDSAASKYLKVYNKQSYDDVFEGEVMKTGIGFTYRKRYPSFTEIFQRKRRKKQP